MSLSAIDPPQQDPVPIFELFRGNHGTELLTAAVAHLDVFRHLATGPRSFETLQDQPTQILCTGRYLDKLAWSPAGLRFREKTCVYDSTLIPGSIVKRFPGAGHLVLDEKPESVAAITEFLRA